MGCLLGAVVTVVPYAVVLLLHRSQGWSFLTTVWAIVGLPSTI